MGVTAEMLLSSTNPDHAMSRRVSVRMGEAGPVGGERWGPSRDPRGHGSRARRPGWAPAFTGSALVHVTLLALLGALGHREAPRVESVVVEVLPAPPELAADPAMREASAEALPDPPLATADEAPPRRRPDGVEGDRDVVVPVTAAPRDADGRERVVPAPDQGEVGGVRAENAYRRDRSTLRTRLADGAVASQLARLRTARATSSPEPIRRDPTAGVGDAVATVEPSRAPSAAQADTPPAPAGEGAGAPAGARAAPRVDPHPEIARVADRPTRERGVGPLAVEAGARSFDTEAVGPAADTQTARAASNERHPGIADFSRPGVAGPRDAAEGRGPGRVPGAAALMTNGTAATEYGARNADETRTEVTVETGERQYDRYWQEVQRRVQLALIFPKSLAIRLEQGETMVSFAVRPDGSVGEGPRVLKSSGFPEFDAEAVKAVLRAAPFPRRNDLVRKSLMVTFENPLIR